MKYLTIQEVLCIGDLSDFEDRVGELVTALLDLEDDEDVEDPDVAANLPKGRVDVQMVVEASDPANAAVKATCFLRTAIHAIGDATPGWETSRTVLHVAPADTSDRLFAGA
mgnify:CR=1 FL=1